MYVGNTFGRIVWKMLLNKIVAPTLLTLYMHHTFIKRSGLSIAVQLLYYSVHCTVYRIKGNSTGGMTIIINT